MISPFHDSSEDSSNSEKSDSEIEEVSKSKNSKDEVFNNSNYHSPNKKVRQNDRILQSFGYSFELFGFRMPVHSAWFFVKAKKSKKSDKTPAVTLRFNVSLEEETGGKLDKLSALLSSALLSFGLSLNLSLGSLKLSALELRALTKRT